MIGERLAEIRKDHHDTQASLAKKLVVSIPTIRAWEQNKSDPSYQTLCKICRMYNVSSDYLLGLNNDDPLLHKEKTEYVLTKVEYQLLYELVTRLSKDKK